ncbi:MAG: transglycosylase domain-containing protein, partial [Lentisphaeria bacterium]|nr:transglycosylase domain-containing protein [Lentisphaeria bacterium]
MMQNCRAYLQKLYRWSSGKKYILFAGAAAAAGTLWGTVWYIVPACLPDPMAELKHETPVRMVYSASGECIGVRRTWDWQWRKPVPLSEVSRHVKTVILAVEDEAFFEHDGVDFCAVLRAAWQGITAGRRISGASTITMQLAALPTAGKRKNIADKIRQVFRARALEMRYSKEEILSEY